MGRWRRGEDGVMVTETVMKGVEMMLVSGR